MTMDLLSFSRGIALKFAIGIFLFGITWRLVSMLLLRYPRDLNEPRNGVLHSLMAGVATTGTRSWPHKEFVGRIGAGEALGYSYHLGLFAIILAFGPHIALFRSLVGFSWPALPSSVITIVSVFTLALFVAVLFRRVTSRVMRLLSNFDDYFSWCIVALTIGTGLAATAHVGAPYNTLLALHILSCDVLLIWFPFGKLMHAVYLMPSRALNGYLLNRKGAPS